MTERLHTIAWEAHPYFPKERGNDWYWVLGIVGVSGSIAAFILGNVLFGIVIILGMLVIMMYAQAETHEAIPYKISPAGIQINTKTHPYTKLESFWIDREHYLGPHLLVKCLEGIDHILTIPIPEEYVDEIDETLAHYMPEEHIKEPLSHRIFEMLGF